MKILWLVISVAAMTLVALYAGAAWYYKLSAWSVLSSGAATVVSLAPAITSRVFFKPYPTPQPAQNTTVTALAITKIILSNGVTRYILNGTFVTPFVKGDNSLSGEFVIDGDPTASHITVIISPTAGPVLLGKPNEINREETVWEEKTLPNVQQAVGVNTPAQIWWSLPPYSPQSQDQILAGILDQANEKPQNLQGLQLTVQAVGVLAN